jgi:hypothetical protein
MEKIEVAVLTTLEIVVIKIWQRIK